MKKYLKITTMFVAVLGAGLFAISAADAVPHRCQSPDGSTLSINPVGSGQCDGYTLCMLQYTQAPRTCDVSYIQTDIGFASIHDASIDLNPGYELDFKQNEAKFESNHDGAADTFFTVGIATNDESCTEIESVGIKGGRGPANQVSLGEAPADQTDIGVGEITTMPGTAGSRDTVIKITNTHPDGASVMVYIGFPVGVTVNAVDTSGSAGSIVIFPKADGSYLVSVDGLVVAGEDEASITVNWTPDGVGLYNITVSAAADAKFDTDPCNDFASIEIPVVDITVTASCVDNEDGTYSMGCEFLNQDTGNIANQGNIANISCTPDVVGDNLWSAYNTTGWDPAPDTYSVAINGNLGLVAADATYIGGVLSSSFTIDVTPFSNQSCEIDCWGVDGATKLGGDSTNCTLVGEGGGRAD